MKKLILLPFFFYSCLFNLLGLQASVWIMCHVQFVLFTTKSTKDTKVRMISKGGLQTRPYETFVLFVSFVVKTSSQ